MRLKWQSIDFAGTADGNSCSGSMRSFSERNAIDRISGGTSTRRRETIQSGHTYGRLPIDQSKESVQNECVRRRIAPVFVMVLMGRHISCLPLRILTASSLCLAFVSGFAEEQAESPGESEAQPVPQIEEVATDGGEQTVPREKPSLKREGDLSADELVIFTPEAQARIRHSQELEAARAKRSRGVVVRGRVVEIDPDPDKNGEGTEGRGLIVLEEYTAFPSESLIARELLNDELLLHAPEERARFLKELHLAPLDYNLLNRWELPWFLGTSAEERARMLEEQARFEAFKERTEKMLSSLKESNPEAYRDLKKLLDDRRHERTANRE